VDSRRRDDPVAHQESADRRGEDRRVTVGGVRPVRLTQGWLCFESSAERRRLQPIPPDWHHLPDAELEELIKSARVAPQRKGTNATVAIRRR
jgi:hypothetical protein